MTQVVKKKARELRNRQVRKDDLEEQDYQHRDPKEEVEMREMKNLVEEGLPHPKEI